MLARITHPFFTPSSPLHHPFSTLSSSLHHHFIAGSSSLQVMLTQFPLDVAKFEGKMEELWPMFDKSGISYV